MSMTLTLWKAPLVPDGCAAEMLLRRWYEREDDREFCPSESIAAFAEALLRRHPPPQDAESSGQSPWADFPFQQTDRIIDLSISWSADPQAIDDICALAREHELLMYDPQSGDVHLPGDPEESDLEPLGSPGLGAIAMAFGVTLLGAALAWAGWRLSIVVLNWLLIVLGVFILGVGLILLYAFIVEPFREPPVRDRGR